MAFIAQKPPKESGVIAASAPAIQPGGYARQTAWWLGPRHKGHKASGPGLGQPRGKVDLSWYLRSAPCEHQVGLTILQVAQRLGVESQDYPQ